MKKVFEGFLLGFGAMWGIGTAMVVAEEFLKVVKKEKEKRNEEVKTEEEKPSEELCEN